MVWLREKDTGRDRDMALIFCLLEPPCFSSDSDLVMTFRRSSFRLSTTETCVVVCFFIFFLSSSKIHFWFIVLMDI